MAPVADAEIVQGQVTIVSAQTCGLNFVSGSPINYGSLSIGQVSNEQTLVIDNTGTAQGALSVSGTNWLSGATTVMNVGATQYAPTPGVAYRASTQDISDDNGRQSRRHKLLYKHECILAVACGPSCRTNSIYRLDDSNCHIYLCLLAGRRHFFFSILFMTNDKDQTWVKNHDR